MEQRRTSGHQLSRHWATRGSVLHSSVLSCCSTRKLFGVMLGDPAASEPESSAQAGTCSGQKISQDFQLQHHWFPRYHCHGLIMFKKGPQNSHFVLQKCSLMLPSASFKQAQSDTVGLQPWQIPRKAPHQALCAVTKCLEGTGSGYCSVSAHLYIFAS